MQTDLSSPDQQSDQDAIRHQVLAQIYRILLRATERKRELGLNQTAPADFGETTGAEDTIVANINQPVNGDFSHE